MRRARMPLAMPGHLRAFRNDGRSTRKSDSSQAQASRTATTDILMRGDKMNRDGTYTLKQWIRSKAREHLASRKAVSVVVAEAVRQRELNPSLSVEECFRRAMVGLPRYQQDTATATGNSTATETTDTASPSEASTL